MPRSVVASLQTGRLLNLLEGGFGVSRVAGLANFNPRLSEFTFKSNGFSGLEICRGLRDWPYFVLGFRVLHSKFLFRRVFEVIQSTVHMINLSECFTRGAGSR